MKGALNNVNFIGMIHMIREKIEVLGTHIFRELLSK